MAQSPHLKNLKELYLSSTKIDVEALKALVKFLHLPNLEKLTIDSLHMIYCNCKKIEAIAELRDPRIEFNGLGSDSCNIFYHFLLKKAYFTLDEKDIKEMIMDLAASNDSSEVMKHILENSDKYPFLINSRDEQGHTLLHFYTHSPEMQKFLFERGIIPEEERNQRRDDERIARDSQSIHASPIVKRTNFFAKKLVESTKASKEQLKQAAAS